MENVSEALKLMSVGMSTVFLVLALIIALGNQLVNFVNKYCPEEEKPKGQTAVRPQTQAVVSPEIAEVIGKAVEQVYGGKAMVERIEKI